MTCVEQGDAGDPRVPKTVYHLLGVLEGAQVDGQAG
jgi:hypothetical protein